MAHHKAAKKSIRQAEKRNESNRYYGKTTRNAIRKLRAAEPAEADKMLPDVLSMIDKLAKRNVIHKNKAGNLKSAGSCEIIFLFRYFEPDRISYQVFLFLGLVRRICDGRKYWLYPKAACRRGPSA